MHQYTQKLSKTATNATVFSPSCFPSHHYADGVETPTTSITKLESAKSAVTGAVILSHMQKKCVSLVSHLFYQLAAFIFPYSLDDDKYLHGFMPPSTGQRNPLSRAGQT